MKKEKSVAARFSASASSYDALADVQVEVANQLMHFVEKGKSPECILEIGCGTGILTEKICNRFPDADFYAVDISPEMVGQAQKKLSKGTSIKWLVADARNLPYDSFFDLVFSSSSLHWILPVENTFGKINEMLHAHGQCIFSCMVEGTFKELHQARQIVAPGKKRRVRLPSTDELHHALHRNNFDIKKDMEKTIQVQFRSAQKFLDGIHGQGVTGGESSTPESLLSRTELDELISYYDSHYRNDKNMVFASYEVKFIVAQKRD